MSTEPRNGHQTRRTRPDGALPVRAPMNPASFVTGTITILPKPTRVYHLLQRVRELALRRFPKLPATDYTVTLSGKVADPYGNTLGQDYVLKFRTRRPRPAAAAQQPEHVGTYSAYTETQAVVVYRNMPEVRFDLYSVTHDDFIG